MIAIALVVSAVVLLPSAARAGTYNHVACTATSASLADHGGGWSPFSSATTGWPLAQNRCGAWSGAGWRGMYADLGLDVGVGAAIGWKYRAPPGTRIAAAEISMLGWLRPVTGVPVAVERFTNGDATLAQLTPDDNGRIFPAPYRISIPDIGAGELGALLTCTGLSGTCTAGDGAGWIALTDAVVRLDDDTAPVLDSATGGLLASETLSGAADLAVAAHDVGGGVRELRIRSDGEVVQRFAAADGTCEPVSGSEGSWTFTAVVPCPSDAQWYVAVDTRVIPDGRHEIRLELVDAAGNVRTAVRTVKNVDNALPQTVRPPGFDAAADVARPRVGVAIGGDAGAWDRADARIGYQWERCDATGARCRAIDGAVAAGYTPVVADVGSRLRLVVVATLPGGSRGEATPLTGVVLAAAAGASSPVAGTCADRTRLLRRGSGVVRVRYAQRAPVTLTLTCGDGGAPLPGAQLVVAEQSAGGGGGRGAWYLRTDGAGRAVLEVGRGPSRTLIVSAPGDDASRLRIKVLVRSRITLGVRQHGMVARFRGRVVGGYVPRRGVAVELQWRDGRRWRPVASTTTDRRGRYSYDYRFSPRARGFRYRFRMVVARGQIDYPFEPGRSGVRTAGL